MLRASVHSGWCAPLLFVLWTAHDKPRLEANVHTERRAETAREFPECGQASEPDSLAPERHNKRNDRLCRLLCCEEWDPWTEEAHACAPWPRETRDAGHPVSLLVCFARLGLHAPRSPRTITCPFHLCSLISEPTWNIYHPVGPVATMYNCVS